MAMNDNHRHESAWVNARLLHRVALGLGIALVLIAALMYPLLRFWLAPQLTAGLQAPPPAPRLQADPAADLAAERAQQRQRLERYGWVERVAGFAQIPIERAMALLVASHATPATSDAADSR
jgi:hypothetical protein